MDNAKNFAISNVSAGYDAAATSIVLSSGGGARMPTAPFNATWWNATDYSDPSDDPNVEIVRVTAVSTDTLTITRAQESTSASTKNTAAKQYRLLAGLTAKVINQDLNPVIPTADEKAALAGTSGSPSGSNKYVTNSDSRLAAVSPPTGTGFRHVTSGAEDGAAKLVENADVAAAAAIAESKLALNYPTHSALNDPSANEKAALAGTSGTPGSSNRFVTNADSRLTDARTPSAHTHPESEVTGLVTDLAGKQPLDADLTAVAALSTTGFVRRTGAGAFSAAAITSSELPLWSVYSDEVSNASALTAGSWYRIAKTPAWAYGAAVIRMRYPEGNCEMWVSFNQGLPTLQLTQNRGYNWSVASLVEVRLTKDQGGAGAWDRSENIGWVEVKVNSSGSGIAIGGLRFRIFNLYGNNQGFSLNSEAFTAGVDPNGTTLLDVGGLQLVFSEASYANSCVIWGCTNRWGNGRFYMTSYGDLRIENGTGQRIVLGSDTTLYRSAALTLKTDNNMIVAGNLTAGTLQGVVKAVAGLLTASPVSDGDVSATAAIAQSKIYGLVADLAARALNSEPVLVWGEPSGLTNSKAVSAAGGLQLISGTDLQFLIADDGVTDAKLRNSAACSVIGRSAGSVGNPADIAAGSDGQVLRRAAGLLGFGSIPEASVDGLVNDLNLRVQLGGQLGGSAASPDVRGIRETNGPTLLAIGDIQDGTFLKRVGSLIYGANITIYDVSGLYSELSSKQLSDPDLTAIAALSATGYAKRTGTNTWSLLSGPDWTEITGKPATFTPAAHTHAISEVTSLQTSLDAKAPTSRNIATANSLTGGGALTADRTLSLVNDSAAPGANKVYGTDGSGVRGWKADPSGSGFTPTLYSAALSSIVDLTNASQWYDGPSLSLPAGTYLITAAATFQRSSADDFQAHAKLLSGATCLAAGSTVVAYLSSGNGIGSIHLSAAVTLSATTTVKLQGAAGTTLVDMIEATWGVTSPATYLYATRIA